MSSFILSQILVGIAIITNLLSFQFKERRRILACLLVSCTLVSFHFMLLGYWTAAGLGMLAGIRFITGYFTTSKKIMALFLFIALLVSTFTYSGYLSLISCLAALCNTTGSFCSNDKHMRQLMFFGTGLWIIHNTLAGSPTAVLLEVIFLTSNIIGYYRYYFRPSLKARFSHP